MTTKIEISVKTLITIAVFFLALGIIYLIKDVLILLFISFILKSALTPLVERLEHYSIPRVAAIVLIYAVVIGIFAAIIAIIVPVFVGQVVSLVNNFPMYVDKLSQLTHNTSLQGSQFDTSITQEVSRLSSGILGFTISFFGDVISFITVFVVTFYLLLDEKNLKSRLHAGLPYTVRDRALDIMAQVERRLGGWVRGQLVLSAMIGILYFVGLLLLGVQSPLALGLIGGVCEVIPIIGPILAAIPAVLIAFTQSPILALAVIALYFIVQQMEGHVIVPNVMQKATGLSPLVVLIAVLIGARVLGAIGVIISVPLAVVMQVMLFDFWGIGTPSEPQPTLVSEVENADDH